MPDDRDRYTGFGDAVGTRTLYWFLVDGDRWTVTGTVLLAVYLLTVAVVLAAPAAPAVYITADPSVATMLLYFITGIVTIITLVLTINQLVLSHQIGPVSNQQQEIRSMLDHRSDAKQVLDGTVPEEPAAFLTALLHTITDTAATIQGRHDDRAGDTVLTRIQDDAAPVIATLDEAPFGTTAFLAAIMAYRGSDKLGAIRSRNIKAAEDEPVAQLESALELFAISEEYFKTAYIQTQLIALSRALVYTAIPTLIVVSYGTQFLRPDTFPGTVLGIPTLLLVTAAVFAITLLPFTLLITYMARLVVLARTTVFTGPFADPQHRNR